MGTIQHAVTSGSRGGHNLRADTIPLSQRISYLRVGTIQRANTIKERHLRQYEQPNKLAGVSYFNVSVKFTKLLLCKILCYKIDCLLYLNRWKHVED